VTPSAPPSPIARQLLEDLREHLRSDVEHDDCIVGAADLDLGPNLVLRT